MTTQVSCGLNEKASRNETFFGELNALRLYCVAFSSYIFHLISQRPRDNKCEIMQTHISSTLIYYKQLFLGYGSYKMARL